MGVGMAVNNDKCYKSIAFAKRRSRINETFTLPQKVALAELWLYGCNPGSAIMAMFFFYEMQNGTPFTIKDVSERLKISGTTATKHVNNLKTLGVVNKTMHTKPPQYAFNEKHPVVIHITGRRK